MIIYQDYYVVIGRGESDISSINAFDEALNDAGISEVNLVPVSSIMAEGAQIFESQPKLKTGEIVHCVLSRQDGKYGEEIGAGVACVLGGVKNKKYGLIMEAEGKVSQKVIEQRLKNQVDSMCRLRNFNIENIKIYTQEINKIKAKYGSVIVAVIYR